MRNIFDMYVFNAFLWNFKSWMVFYEKRKTFSVLYMFWGILLISIQVLFHISVNIGLIPTKGLTLPFISYGGTSLLVLMSLLGIVFRINNENKLI